MARKHYTDEERKALLTKIDAMRAEGSTIKDALIKVNIPVGSYNNWRARYKWGKGGNSAAVVFHSSEEKKPRKKYTKKKVEPVVETDRVFMFVGKPSDIAQVMKGI